MKEIFFSLFQKPEKLFRSSIRLKHFKVKLVYSPKTSCIKLMLHRACKDFCKDFTIHSSNLRSFVVLSVPIIIITMVTILDHNKEKTLIWFFKSVKTLMWGLLIVSDILLMAPLDWILQIILRWDFLCFLCFWNNYKNIMLWLTNV